MFEEIGGSTQGVKSPKVKQGKRVAAASAAARRPLLFLNDIRDRAHAKWLNAGMPPGDGARFWLEAEQEMREGR